MIDVKHILHILATCAGITPLLIRFGTKHKRLVHVRQVAHWLIRNLTGASYPETGLVMGGCDHTTSIWACRKVDYDIQHDGPRLAVLLSFIERAQQG